MGVERHCGPEVTEHRQPKTLHVGVARTGAIDATQ
ncbi:hypothetical protein GCWB2_13355 [Gordonia rubripertincta]|nr:hypothetical protein GCWB2_13355 [Gordonia rubripertincta]